MSSAEGSRKPCSTSCLLPGPVAPVHAADLRHGDVALVDKHQKVRRKILEQRRWRLSALSAREMAAVVLDSVAVAHLLEHLDVVVGPALEPLGFDELVQALQLIQSFSQLFLDGFHRALELIFLRHIVAAGVDIKLVDLAQRLSGNRIDFLDLLDFVPPETDSVSVAFLEGGKNLDDIASHTKCSTVEIIVVSFVLDLDQVHQQIVPPLLGAAFQMNDHLAIHFRRAETIDARHAGDDDDVTAREKTACRRMAELVDLIVDRGVLLDKGVARGNVRLGLIVIVVTDEVLHRVFRKELLEFGVKLGGECLVRSQHQRRTVEAGDHIGHRERLAAAGDTKKHLVLSGSPQSP